MNIIEKTDTLIKRYVCPKMKIHDVLKEKSLLNNISVGLAAVEAIEDGPVASDV